MAVNIKYSLFIIFHLFSVFLKISKWSTMLISDFKNHHSSTRVKPSIFTLHGNFTAIEHIGYPKLSSLLVKSSFFRGQKQSKIHVFSHFLAPETIKIHDFQMVAILLIAFFWKNVFFSWPRINSLTGVSLLAKSVIFGL